MTSKQFEYYLINFTIGLAIWLVLSFFYRIIRIVTTKEIKTKEDYFCILILVASAYPVIYVYQAIKLFLRKSKYENRR